MKNEVTIILNKKSVFKATRLQVLFISNANLIFDDDIFENWPQMFFLSLLACSFGNNTIPSSIGSLSYLKALQLGSTIGVESLPNHICKLQNLQVFVCDGCLFKELPSCFGELSSLRTFQMYWTPINKIRSSDI